VCARAPPPLSYSSPYHSPYCTLPPVQVIAEVDTLGKLDNDIIAPLNGFTDKCAAPPATVLFSLCKRVGGGL
jgi:hypothetical protein